jgi:PAS domain S-box-containing protein
MGLRARLALVLSVVFLINLVLGVYAIRTYKEATAREAQVHERSSAIVSASLSAQVHFKKQVQEWKDILLRGHDTDMYDKYLAQFYDEEGQTREAIEDLIPMLARNPEAQEIARQFLAAHRLLGIRYREALRYFGKDARKPQIEVDRRVRGIDRQPTDLLDLVVTSAIAHKESELAHIKTSVAYVEKRMLLIVLSVMTGTIVVLLWLTNRTIVRPLATAIGIARRISSGDLSGTIEVRGRDEAAQLLQALRTMQSSLVRYRETVRESEERTRLLLDSSGEGIYGVDLEGRCMFCNPAALQMLGYGSAAEILGRDMHALMHHTFPDGSPYPVEECRASRTYRDGISVHVDDELFWRADGSSVPVEYRSHPIRHDGLLIGAVVTFADITERRHAEEALREAHASLASERALLAERVQERTAELHAANEELARIAKAKDLFLASMSHELRTPLTSILGISETLADQLYGPLSEQQMKAITTVQESAAHLLSLINDILDVAKVEAGKMVLSVDTVPVEQLCEASLRLVRQTARQKGLKISSVIDPRVRVIGGDSRRLKQLLVNLLGNAVKFTPDGGTIGLEVTGEPERERARFSVWDTGIGIAQDQLNKLFRPFMQLDNKLSRHYTGTGLGLALVYRMAEMHGGSVAVESTPGTGSRFTVFLPWNPEARQGAGTADQETLHVREPERDDREEGGEMTIVLAEDNEANATTVASYLEAVGYRVITARNGVQAIAEAMAHRPDLILMDIQMPEMDGLEAMQHLRDVRAFDRTPIIALTALTMPGDRERCLEAGADDYLPKPVGLKELQHTIRMWISRR